MESGEINSSVCCKEFNLLVYVHLTSKVTPLRSPLLGPT